MNETRYNYILKTLNSKQDIIPNIYVDNDTNDLIINKRPKVLVGDTKIEVALKSDIPAVSTNYVTTDTDQTISGIKTFNKPANVSGQEIATLKVKTAQGGAIVLGKEAVNSGTMIRLDQSDGTCRLRLRTSSVAGAVVWEQPENNSKLFMDFKNNSGEVYRIGYPQKAGTLALKSDIPTVPTKTSDLTNDSGFITSANIPTFQLNGTELTITLPE